MASHDTRRYSHERYARLLENTFAEIKKLGELKGGEYSGDDDRLLNFRRNAASLDLPAEIVLLVYAAKHWDAINQYAQDIKNGKARTRLESLSGRCDDLITYMVLFKAMLDESSPDVDARNILGGLAHGVLSVGSGIAGLDPARRDDGGDMVLRTGPGRLVPRAAEQVRRYLDDTSTPRKPYVEYADKPVPRDTGDMSAQLKCETADKYTSFYEMVDEMPISRMHKAFLKEAISELPAQVLRDGSAQPQTGADVANGALKE